MVREQATQPEQTIQQPSRLPRTVQLPQPSFAWSWQLLHPTLEQVAYTLLALAAIVTRFWDLGSRALHHDESLHAYFSWVYAEGRGYIHHPLMHGPALFHLVALAFLLFGSSDFASRIPAALFGVALVLMPALLRDERLLGRWGALIASLLLLCSPSILYYSRFIRHDIFALAGTALLAIAILRYLERPERRWLITGLATIGFLLTTHEVTYILIALFIAFLGIAMAFRVAPALFWVAGAGLVAEGILISVLHRLGVAPLPAIPWENPSWPMVRAFLVALLVHPLIVGTAGVLLLCILAALWVLNRARQPGEGWIDGLLGQAPPGSVAYALHTALRDQTGLIAGITIALAIFVTLYTSIFTNLGGLLSGTFGAIGYWLGQHDVQRGEQPWFYYLLLTPQYEFIAVLLFPIGILLVVAQAMRALIRGHELSSRWRLRAFLAFWSLGILAALSWAGEKMPWLVVHIALPLTLLAASLLGSLAEYLVRHWAHWETRQRRLAVGLAGLSGLLLAAWFFAFAWASAGPYTTVQNQLQRVPRPEALAHWRWLWLPLLLLLVLTLALSIDRRLRQFTLGVALGCTAILLLAQIHVGWRLTYRQGDVPLDMLVYVQTSPQVVQLTHELETLSHETTGGMGLDIWYDSGTQWPFNWYLREFPNARYFGTSLSSLPAQPPSIILYSLEFLTPQTDTLLRSRYTVIEYPMRWWFPEEQTYRRFAIAPELKNPARQNYQTSQPPPYSAGDVLRSVWSSIASLAKPDEQAKLFRLVMYRELPAPIGSYRFRVYIRNDLVPYFDQLHYGGQ